MVYRVVSFRFLRFHSGRGGGGGKAGGGIVSLVYNFTFECPKQARHRKSCAIFPLQLHNFHWWRFSCVVSLISWFPNNGNAWSSLEHGKKLERFSFDRVEKRTFLFLEQGPNPVDYPAFHSPTPLPPTRGNTIHRKICQVCEVGLGFVFSDFAFLFLFVWLLLWFFFFFFLGGGGGGTILKIKYLLWTI